MSSTSISSPTTRLVDRLAETLPDRVISRSDSRWDEARAMYFTGMDRRPAAIVRPRATSEVAEAVRIARDAGAPLTVRGGGHSLAGHGFVDDLVALDLRELDQVEIDPAGGTALVGGGVTAGNYTEAAAAHGLATPFGDAPSVGIVGLAGAGGVGFLHRRFGLTADNLMGAEVVTADGRTVLTDSTTYPELFWALRGGGGGLGIITRARFRLHPLDGVTGGSLLLPGEPRTLQRLIALLVEAPDELSGIAAVFRAPAMPMFPEELQGRFLLWVTLVHTGQPNDAQRDLAPLRGLAEPFSDDIAPKNLPALYHHDEGPPPPVHARIHSGFMDELSEADAEGIFEHLATPSSARMSMVQFRVMGGKVRAVPPALTAFAHRTRGMMIGISRIFDDASRTEEHTEWAAALARELGDSGMSGAYIGFAAADEPDLAARTHPGRHGTRLAGLRRHWDPDGVFRGAGA